MRLSREQVEHVALLARLELNEAEKQRYMVELNQILEHLERLNELNTEQVPPTTHAIPMTNVLRPDEVGLSLAPGEALHNAPDAEAGCFRVPRVVES